MTSAKTRFTPEEIETLREHYEKIKLIDPSLPAYSKLCDVLDKASDHALGQLWEAKIKFVGMLARNRLIKRGVKL